MVELQLISSYASLEATKSVDIKTSTTSDGTVSQMITQKR